MEKTSIKHIVRNTFHFTNLWGSIIPMQFIGVYAMYTITSDAPSWWWISTIIGYVCLKMLGVSAGYHRLFSHKGFTVNLITKRILLWFGILAGQGSPLFWIGIHRGYHHRYADRTGDPHPPTDIPKTVFGFYPRVSDYVSKRLATDPYYVAWHRYYFAFLAAWAIAVLLIFGFQGFYFIYIMPVAGAIIISNSQNYWGHVPSKIAPFLSYRSYNVTDNSHNNWIMAILGFGEGYHNNHHRYPGSARFGLEKHEFDLSYLQIKTLEFVGLAENIKVAKT